MKSGDLKYFNNNYLNIGPGVLLSFVVLVALIVGGNALLLWQFQRARLQTERLSGGNQQVVAVLRLRESLLLFHQRLDELVRSREAQRVATEAGPLRRTLLDQIQHTRDTLIHLPPETHVDPAFLPTLDAIAIDLSSQVDVLTALARTGDWEIMRIRLANAMELLETQISVLVKSIEQEANEELSNAAASMRNVQGRIIFLIPTTAISTFFIAAFFAWAITRRIVELRLEERVNERTRIARDLHDTLLQSFQGCLLKFSAVKYVIRSRPDEAEETLERIIDQARSAVTEGRDAVQGLRASTVVANDLARAIGTFGEGLAADQAGPNCPEFCVQVEGKSRDLPPLVRDEVCRVACEALRNAFRHAQAKRIEVEFRYDPRQFRLRVADNGKGIDPAVLSAGGRARHHGLPGLKERAELAGGKLTVWSRLDSGTEIELTIPGLIAYTKSPPDSRSMASGKGTE